MLLKINLKRDQQNFTNVAAPIIANVSTYEHFIKTIVSQRLLAKDWLLR